MPLLNFRKLLLGKTKKNKASTNRKGKKSVKRKPVKSVKQKPVKKNKKKPSKTQRSGGGNYRLDVAKNCKIGGLPVVSPVNDCPKGVGPADPEFGTAIYTQPVVGGARNPKKGTQKKPNHK